MTPPRHRVAVVSWLAIYPTITLVLPGLEAFGVNDLALPLRTLAIRRASSGSSSSITSPVSAEVPRVSVHAAE